MTCATFYTRLMRILNNLEKIFSIYRERPKSIFAKIHILFMLTLITCNLILRIVTFKEVYDVQNYDNRMIYFILLSLNSIIIIIVSYLNGDKFKILTKSIEYAYNIILKVHKKEQCKSNSKLKILAVIWASFLLGLDVFWYVILEPSCHKNLKAITMYSNIILAFLELQYLIELIVMAVGVVLVNEYITCIHLVLCEEINCEMYFKLKNDVKNKEKTKQIVTYYKLLYEICDLSSVVFGPQVIFHNITAFIS